MSMVTFSDPINAQPLEGQATPRFPLRSFPGVALTVPAHAYVFSPQTPEQTAVPREAWVQRCEGDLRRAIAAAEGHHGRPMERLLLLLPDKTRTQQAANLLLDAVLRLRGDRPDLSLTLLYGLGTHPLMEEADIQRLIGADRYQTLTDWGVKICQQSTKAVTNPMAFVTIWQDTPTQEILGRQLRDLTEPLLTAWANATQRAGHLWLGLFPELVTQHWLEVMDLLRSLPAQRPHHAAPILLDCHHPKLNQRLAAQLTDLPDDFQIPTIHLGPEHAPEEGLEIRFLDLHGVDRVTLRRGDRYGIEVPEWLFTHDLAVVAGDTRIHPYEGRYGSGGINKMLAVGIASMDEIRRSHSTRILMHPHTCVGEPRSPFVQRVAATARSICYAMQSAPHSRAMANPYGLTAIGASEAVIWDVAFGQDEAARQPLATRLTQRFTVPVAAPLDVVVSDVEQHKATDITAGARVLQYVCDWHRPDNPLLNQPEQGCVALLFNPCGEAKNNGGVGNDGTKLHMDVLGDLLQRLRPQLGRNLALVTTVAAAQQVLTIARQTVLERWQQHLRSVSEATEWLEELERLAQAGQAQVKHGDTPRDLKRFLLERIERYRRGANHVNRAIATLEHRFQQTEDWDALLQALKETALLYQEHEGLGEGGQRTLRLLKLCRTFKTFAIATRNRAVLDYLAWLDPEVTSDLPEPIRMAYQGAGIRASVLGLVPLDLSELSADAGVDTALRYGRWHKPDAPRLELGFLTHPLILQRDQPTDQGIASRMPPCT